MLRPCNFCANPYEAEPRYLNRGQGLFCSQICSRNYRTQQLASPEPNKICSMCGIQFYRKPSKVASKSGHYYCCKKHQDLGNLARLHKSGPTTPLTVHPTGTSNPINCIFCGKSMNMRSHLNIHKHCNQQLMILNWLNGDNNASLYCFKETGLPLETKKFVKDYLIKTRGNKCEVCGWDECAPDGRSIIQMDHINGNCFDNELSNLKLLCPNHHAMTPTYGSLNRGSGRAHRRSVKSV